MISAPLPLAAAPIQFGTDGWRGVLGVDITIERLLAVARAAAQELAFRCPNELISRKIIIGYDRRFLAPELAAAIASAVRACELEPFLTKTSVPTPACSWVVVEQKALGALVVTASHNPPEWLGLKIKGPFGGSVEGDFTNAVEQRLSASKITIPVGGETKILDAREDHLNGLRKKFDIPELQLGLKKTGMKIIIDPMHGSAAGCMPELLGDSTNEFVHEIRSQRDPLFGGRPPEPLAKNLNRLIQSVKESNALGTPAIGIAFDGDGDRIAAVDEFGRFCSTQLLMPILIDHLARVRKLPGKVVKTVSGGDLMRLVAENLEREVLELPVGFKHIAAEMLAGEILIGGEESGGVGFGGHIPERDALFAALTLLQAIVDGGKLLGERIDELQKKFGGASLFERIDLRLPNMDSRKRLEALLSNTPPKEVAGQLVREVSRKDGVKLRMGDHHWLMMRFSGTEPLLRLYCEAPTQGELKKDLSWAVKFANNS